MVPIQLSVCADIRANGSLKSGEISALREVYSDYTGYNGRYVTLLRTSVT